MIMQNLEINPNTYYTPDEVAIMLRISRQSVRMMLESGLTRGIKIGRNWRILGRDLLQLPRAPLRACRQQMRGRAVWPNTQDVLEMCPRRERFCRRIRDRQRGTELTLRIDGRWQAACAQFGAHQFERGLLGIELQASSGVEQFHVERRTA